MSNTPGTVSKILWHFTGGPTWDSITNRQSSLPKPVLEAFDSLVSIIESKKLKASSFHEIFRGEYNFMQQPIVRDSGNTVRKQLANFSDRVVSKEIETSKVVCLADIPIQHLMYHATRYGRVAIGFKRHAIIQAGFNPVLYSLEDSHVSSALVELIQNLIYMRKVRLNYQCDDFMCSSFKIPEIIKELLRIEENVTRIASQVKSFKVAELESIYCEREWRKIDDFSFVFEDVAMIVVPEEGDFFNNFIDRLPLLPRTIPICSWEQLIEH